MSLYICTGLLMGFYKIIIRRSISYILFVTKLIFFILFLGSLAILLFLVLETIQSILFIKFFHPTHLIIFILSFLVMMISHYPQTISLPLTNSYIFICQYYLSKFLIYHNSLSPSHSI